MKSRASRLADAVAWRWRRLQLDVRHFPVRFRAWYGFKRGMRRYRILPEDELRATRKSDTVFIFGSGWSLNAISPQEWRSIANHDTIGFNWFVHQRFVRCDYHLVREIAPTDLDPAVWKAYLFDYFDQLRRNPHFSDTVLLLQTGFRATNGNRAIWLALVPEHQRVFLWKSIQDTEPSRSLRQGLAHGHGTLSECVNFAVLMGWKNIVLAGVDLYDRRYFWLATNQPRPEDPHIDAVHATASAGIVESIGAWKDQFRPSGVQLYAYNPRSLLTKVLPVWSVVES